MGAKITVEKANSLFWLGRYIERVYTTTLYYTKLFDTMLDQDQGAYHEYCKQLDIPDYYENNAHFMMAYLYYLDNPDSIYSNLKRAYDNAIVLRDEISSEVLAYMQMAVNTLDQMEYSQAPILDLQSIIDDIFAFWGSIQEYMDEGAAKDIVKLGKYVERTDLYSRLNYSKEALHLTHRKLVNRCNHLNKEADVKGLSDVVLDENYNQEVLDITECFNF